jgi:hypothetical protein
MTIPFFHKLNVENLNLRGKHLQLFNPLTDELGIISCFLMITL